MQDKKTTFLVKLDEDLKASFQAICKARDTDASKEVRAFMREYVRKHGQGELFATSKKGKN